MIKNIEHIAIFAANPKALVDWYCEHLGFRVVAEDSGQFYFIALPDGDMIEVGKAADKDRAPATFEEAGLRHVAFTVENYDEFAERLAAAGIEFYNDSHVVPGDNRVNFFEDPEGNILQIVQRAEPIVERRA